MNMVIDRESFWVYGLGTGRLPRFFDIVGWVATLLRTTRAGLCAQHDKGVEVMKVTIELPELVEINAGETTVQFSWSEVASDKLLAFIAEAACVGVAKAGNDSASGAKAHAEKNGLEIETARRELIESWVEARYQSGEFGRSGVGESAETREAKSMLRVQVKAGDAKKYKNASPEERSAMVDKAWDKLADEQKAAYLKTAKARLELKAKQAAELASLATGVKI